MKGFGSQDAFAAYSMPRSNHHTLIWSDRGFWTDEEVEIPSFIVQAFQSHGKSPIKIPADHVAVDQAFSFEAHERCSEESTQEKEYLLSAKETIAAIRRDDFTKVVMSKIKRVRRSKDDDVFQLFEDLKKKYINAFVFMYHIPGHGLWCGATPEVLLRDKGKHLHTMALAATQPDLRMPLELVEWGEKEQHEQHVIETFIEGKLEDEGKKYTKNGPRTVRAGAMLHICTDYYMEDKYNGLGLAELLHPGPAICGLPQSLAREWIGTYEEHERKDYCGYIGPWLIANREGIRRTNSALFINLRSMTIWKDAYLLYLGGGLTAMSDPHAEWNETELKASTLLSVLKQKSHV